MMIGGAFGYNANYAINPVRDFGPRLMTYICGWGPQVFQYRNHFIVPLIASPIGTILGTLFYSLAVSINLHENVESREQAKEMTETADSYI